MRPEPFSLSLRRPLDTARGPIESREGFLVRLEHADRPGRRPGDTRSNKNRLTGRLRQFLQKIVQVVSRTRTKVFLKFTPVEVLKVDQGNLFTFVIVGISDNPS